jgi:hypothetical protein
MRHETKERGRTKYVLPRCGGCQVWHMGTANGGTRPKQKEEVGPNLSYLDMGVFCVASYQMDTFACRIHHGI